MGTVLWVVAGLVFWWGYRKIGVLNYKIDHAHSHSDSISAAIHFPLPPNLIHFIFLKAFGRWFYWLFGAYSALSFVDWKDRSNLQTVYNTYREIYSWPFRHFRRHCKEIRFNILEHLAYRKCHIA